MVVMMMMTTVQSSSSVSPLSSDHIPPWTPPMPSLQASLHHPEIIIKTIIVIVAIIIIAAVIIVVDFIIIITRPKPAYGRNGLAGGSFRPIWPNLLVYQGSRGGEGSNSVLK